MKKLLIVVGVLFLCLNLITIRATAESLDDTLAVLESTNHALSENVVLMKKASNNAKEINECIVLLNKISSEREESNIRIKQLQQNLSIFED